MLPDLVGGAEAFGLLPLKATNAAIAALIADAPPGAAVSMHLLATGSAGFDDAYDGFNMLLLVNYCPELVDNPSFGANGACVGLRQRGYVHDSAFGGTGAAILTSLPPYAAYAALVPDSAVQYQAAFEIGGVSCWSLVPSLAPGGHLWMAPDTDHDGIRDGWELTYFGSTPTCDPAADDDLDSSGNLAEFIAGTNPHDPTSRLAVSINFRDDHGTNAVVLSWPSAPQRIYTVRAATNLAESGQPRSMCSTTNSISSTM